LLRAERPGGAIFPPPTTDQVTAVRQPSLGGPPKAASKANVVRLVGIGALVLASWLRVPIAAGEAPFFVEEEQTCLA
jgi:hypothetical protein